MWVQSLGLEDPPEKSMATHSSILAWRISWTEKPGGLEPGIHGVAKELGHDWNDLVHMHENHNHRKICTRMLLKFLAKTTQVYIFMRTDRWCAVLSCSVSLTLCDPMDYSSPGPSDHGILQARILESVAMPSSGRSSQPRGQTQGIAGGFFTV